MGVDNEQVYKAGILDLVRYTLSKNHYMHQLKFITANFFRSAMMGYNGMHCPRKKNINTLTFFYRYCVCLWTNR